MLNVKEHNGSTIHNEVVIFKTEKQPSYGFQTGAGSVGTLWCDFSEVWNNANFASLNMLDIEYRPVVCNGPEFQMLCNMCSYRGHESSPRGDFFHEKDSDYDKHRIT